MEEEKRLFGSSPIVLVIVCLAAAGFLVAPVHLRGDDRSRIIRLGSKADRSPYQAPRTVACAGIRRGGLSGCEYRP